MISKEDVVAVLRATLLSCQGAITLEQCNRDYRELEGVYIPYAKLGYNSLEAFVSDSPGLKVHRNHGEIFVNAVPSENSRHISDMVSRQKSAHRRTAPKPRHPNYDSWRKPAPSSSFSSQYYKQPYKPNRNYNNNTSNSYNYNQHSKPSTSYKTPEPPKKQISPEVRQTPVNNKTSPPAKPAPAPLISTVTSTANTNSAHALPKTPSTEKKYSLSARLEAAVLADDSEPTPSPKLSRASSRLSSFRESLHSVELIPLPLPATAAAVPATLPPHQVTSVPIAPRPPTPPPQDATAQETLAWICKRLNLPQPVYKINTIKELKKGPTSYFCIVKVGNDHSATTYPDSSASEDSARELAASRLATEVKRQGVGGGTTTSPDVALTRLAGLVSQHHSGIWASTLPEQYREKYNENLPSNWQDLIESSRQFNTDRGVNGQLMILPSDTETGVTLAKELEWRMGAVGVADSPSLVLELPELKLPDETGWNVFVTTVNSTVEVWLRLIGDQYSNAYHDLLRDIESYYANNGVLVTSVEVNSWYAVKLDEGWHRGLVVEVHDGKALVFLGDHGDDELVQISQLRLLAPRFATLPAQAILCRLDKMEELAASDVGVEIVRSQLVGQVLVAVPAPVVPTSGDRSVAVTLYRTYHDSDDEVNVNEEILKGICKLGEISITEQLCEVEVGCVSAEGHVWVVHPTRARLVRDALSVLTSPGVYHRPIPSTTLHDAAPNSNLLYVVRTLSGTWLRCAVRSGVAADGTVSTRLVDSGQTMRAPLASLVPLASYSRVLALFPHQAKAVRLGSAERAAPAMVERLRELLLNTTVLCRAMPATTPRMPHHTEPNVELYVRRQGVLASVNSTILFEFEEQNILVKPKEERKDNPLEALSRKRERIFSRAVSGGRLPESQPSSQLPPLLLPHVHEWVNVLVTMAANPWNFVVQLTRQRDRQQLTEMMAQLQKHCPDLPATPAPAQAILPAPGDLYTLHYKDDTWYRVVVANVVSHEMVSVYFCDFGDLALVSASQLRRVPDIVRLARELPPQAIKAKLHGVSPLHQDWSVEDCIRFQELTVEQEFAALVHDIGADPLHPTEPLLTIDLVDTRTSDDVYVNQKLESERRAKLTAPLTAST